ncbi:hypothetical protein FISHEDRAFT_72032 [Fistulina hepatica ATCC 64428]|uniref:Uncharacterized protein n=1 Tax=Fistulina hepatica ATCC 64428 TaxID=1128425 RepID=A0A0D7AFL3_9AGAR|nr:hypothetical protein FISHEDRAFT_72032 [Fistulina hepatica ATCC 64428]
MLGTGKVLLPAQQPPPSNEVLGKTTALHATSDHHYSCRVRQHSSSRPSTGYRGDDRAARDRKLEVTPKNGKRVAKLEVTPKNGKHDVACNGSSTDTTSTSNGGELGLKGKQLARRRPVRRSFDHLRRRNASGARAAVGDEVDHSFIDIKSNTPSPSFVSVSVTSSSVEGSFRSPSAGATCTGSCRRQWEVALWPPAGATCAGSCPYYLCPSHGDACVVVGGRLPYGSLLLARAQRALDYACTIHVYPMVMVASLSAGGCPMAPCWRDSTPYRSSPPSSSNVPPLARNSFHFSFSSHIHSFVALPQIQKVSYPFRFTGIFSTSGMQRSLLESTSSDVKFIGGMAIYQSDGKTSISFIRNDVERPRGLQGADCQQVHVLMEMDKEDVELGGSSIDKSISQHFWVISTPNYPVIFEPLLGDRRVCARQDGRFGPDDRSQWPQLHIEGQEWVACIPRPVTDPKLSTHWLSYTLKQRDTIVCDLGRVQTTGSAFRQLNPIIFQGMKTCHDRILARIEMFVQKGAGNPLPLYYRATLASFIQPARFAMEYLDKKARVWKDLVLGWANWQRQVLDLHGMAYWATEVIPEINSLTQKYEKDARPTNTGLMGCFTFNEEIADRMKMYGIPVWYIRPDFTITPTTAILQVGEASFIEYHTAVEQRAFVNDRIEEDPYHVVYEGAAGTFNFLRSMKVSGSQLWPAGSRPMLSGPHIKHPRGQEPVPAGNTVPRHQDIVMGSLPRGDFSFLEKPVLIANPHAEPLDSAPPFRRLTPPLLDTDMASTSTSGPSAASNTGPTTTTSSSPSAPQPAVSYTLSRVFSNVELDNEERTIRAMERVLDPMDNVGLIALKRRREQLIADKMRAHPERYNIKRRSDALVKKVQRSREESLAIRKAELAELREHDRRFRRYKDELLARIEGMRKYRNRHYLPVKEPQIWDPRFDNSKSRGLKEPFVKRCITWVDEETGV